MSDTPETASPPRRRWLRTVGIIVISIVAVVGALVFTARSAMTSDSRLQVGATAPDFTLPDQNGDAVNLTAVLASHRGTIVAFYPKDFTPG